MTLTRTLTTVASATTYTTRECISAGVEPGLQILCRHQLTHRVATAEPTASVARNSGCDDGAASHGPGRAGAKSGVDVARVVAALFVDERGVYANLPGVEVWGKERDARLYRGPHPVVCHPPCERWGRFWFGGPQWLKDGHPRKTLGDDGGCFAAALNAVREFGGVLEHPADSHAWAAHGLVPPPRNGGWHSAGDFHSEFMAWTCCVSQGHYGHRGDKLTWLYAVAPKLPRLKWGKSDKRVFVGGLSKERRARVKRTGIVQALSRKQRAATPVEFRDVLLSIARSVYLMSEASA